MYVVISEKRYDVINTYEKAWELANKRIIEENNDDFYIDVYGPFKNKYEMNQFLKEVDINE